MAIGLAHDLGTSPGTPTMDRRRHIAWSSRQNPASGRLGPSLPERPRLAVPVAALGIASLLYTDSLGSLPMITALLGKGLGVGSAMILLVSGVGTNISTLVPVARELGIRVAVAYAAAVVLMPFALGLLWNGISPL